MSSKQTQSKTERIDKVLSNNGLGSRTDMKRLMRSGAVTVNGVLCFDPAFQVSSNDTILVDSVPFTARKPAYIMLNKPAGVVSAVKDRLYQTVMDLLPPVLTAGYRPGDLFPVGRLDIDTEGLLLITSDGELTHRLTSPKNEIPKTYFARLETAVGKSARAEYVRRFAQGIHICADRGESAYDCKSAHLEFMVGAAPSSAVGCEVLLTITEGKFHQVKRMFSAVGNRVVYLKRITVGSLRLDAALETGQARTLSESEIGLLFSGPNPNPSLV